MENLFLRFPSVRKRLAGGYVLMLDFDGVLAPIVPRPQDARMSAEVRALVRRLSSRVPVVVISGRALRDVKRRVGAPGVMCAGSHGMEWELKGLVHFAPASKEAQDALAQASRALRAVARRHPGVTLEKKPGSIALNYRTLAPGAARVFRREAMRAIVAHARPGVLRVLDHKRTFDAMLDVAWTKGHCAAALFHELQTASGKRLVPVYIGDSLTDEDAFRMLKGGITIRVGRSAHSAARYFVRNREGVDRFLKMLEQEIVGHE